MLTVVLLTTAFLPQEVEEKVRFVGPQPAVIRLGEEARAEIRITTSKNPPPPKLPDVDGLIMQMSGPPSLRQSSTYDGRRLVVSRSLTYHVTIKPLREGRFQIPAFEVRTGSKVQRTRPKRIEVVKDIRGEEHAFLEVKPSSHRVYVHEPLRVLVEYGVSNKLEPVQQMAGNGQRYLDVEVMAPWLSEMEGAQSLAEPAPKEALNLVLNQTLQLAEYEAGHAREGKTYHLFRFQKSFLPTRIGKHELSAPVLRYAVQEGRRRTGIFGEVITKDSKSYYVYGKPLSFEVLALPTQGRPDPYYGAVGRFELEATLDRRRVRVGDSVKLILSIAGQGNIEYLQVPELEETPGFHLLGKIENREKGKVVVTYDLTPKTVEVAAAPGVHWNYFDTRPGVERYVQVATEPLPIEVLPLLGEAALETLPGSDSKVIEPGHDDIYDMKQKAGLESLGLPTAPARSSVLLAALLPWFLGLVGALWLRARRRARADILGQRAKGALRRFAKSLAAGRNPLDALLDYLADRLGCEPAAVIGLDLASRLQASGVASELAAELQQVVEGAIAARYGGPDAVTVDGARVQSLVAALERATFQVRTRTPLGILCGVLFLAGAGAGAALAQAPSAGEKAYRQGEYAKAAEAFLVEAEAGDRRAYYNLGNCLYRQGRYVEALVAYERSKLAMPRDSEILANIKLVRQKLDLGTAEGEAFSQTLEKLRDSLTATEKYWLFLVINVLAALCFCLGGRRLRLAALVFLLPALILLLDVLVLGPNRPPKGIVNKPRVELLAEPRVGLEPLLKIMGGVSLQVLGEGRDWTQVRVRGQKGYLPSDSVAVIR